MPISVYTVQHNMGLSTVAYYIVSALLCAAAALLMRRLIWQQMRRTSAHSENLAVSDSEARHLRPAELAYLFREGDMSHTMLVLVVDLIQRLLKSGGDAAALSMQSYERAIIANVQDVVTLWAHEKIGHVVPVKDLRNPVQWLVRIRAIKTFFGETLRGFLHDLIKDPLHIRRYFSFNCIARFTIDLCTSSARQSVESAMHQELLDRGLLVPTRRRQIGAAMALLTVPAMVGAALLLRAQFVSETGWLPFVVILLMGFLNAAAMRALLALPALIPSYEELSRIVRELPVKNWRIRFLRNALVLARTFMVLSAFVCCLLLLLAEFGFDTMLLAVNSGVALPMLIVATVLGLPCVQALLDWFSLSRRDQASEKALVLVARARAQVVSSSAVSALKGMLSNPQYDPLLSENLAVYGIETLWLIG